MPRPQQMPMLEAYCRQFGRNINSLTSADTTKTSRVLYEICEWQGYFPGEKDDKEVTDGRENNINIMNGDYSSLVTYFKKLGLAQPSEGDWDLIFRLYRDYVLADPTGVSNPIGRPVPTMTLSNPVENNEVATGESMIIDTNVHSIINHFNKEKENMAENNAKDVSVDNLIKDNGGIVTPTPTGALQSLDTVFGNQPNQTPVDMSKAMESVDEKPATGTNLEATGTGKELAEIEMEKTLASRKDWEEKNKIQQLVINADPIVKRVEKGVTTGTITDPKKFIDDVIKRHYKGSGISTVKYSRFGFRYNQEDENNPALPREQWRETDTLAIAGLAAGSYENEVENMQALTQMMLAARRDVLAMEADTKREEVKIDMKSGFSTIKGVVMADNTTMEIPELKEAVFSKGQGIVKFANAGEGVQFQVAALSGKQLAKKIESASKADSKKVLGPSDTVALKLAGRDKLVDMKNGKLISESSCVVLREVDLNQPAAVTDKTVAHSEMSYVYTKKADATKAGSKDKKVTVRFRLSVPMYPYKDIPDGNVLKAFIKSGGIGNTQVASSEDALKIVKEGVAKAFSHASLQNDAYRDKEAAYKSAKAEEESKAASSALQGVVTGGGDIANEIV